MFNCFLRLLMVSGLMLCADFGAATAQSSFLDFLKGQGVGKTAPDFTLDTLHAPKVNKTKFREGKPAILFFWATWCPHCRMALKDLNKMVQDIENKNIKILLIDVGEQVPEVEEYAMKNKLTPDIFLDKESSSAESYGVIGVPTFIFVSSDGKIKAIEHVLPPNYEEILTKK